MKGLRRFFISVMLLVACTLNAMTTNGDQILDAQGQPLHLKGLSWFGFNNQSTMVDGLWGGPDSLSFDFSDSVYRIQLLGFNAVRLPFSFQDLGLTPRNYTQGCAHASVSEIQQNVTNPNVAVPPGAIIPPMVYPAPRAAGMCNDYLPNDTTFNRFLWVVNFFARNGFYVLIDNHLREDQTVLQNQQQWVQDWVNLVSAISQDPISKDRIMIDILNEPDNFGIRWEASGGKPALKDLYLSAMDAIYQVNPNVLFFIEGTGQGGIGANWGDGFATDPILISQYGLSDPNAFFQALFSKPYLNQVVISPHVYPPSVTYASSNYSGTGLWNRLTNSFGYLTQKGYCYNGTCKAFPVALGEFGSYFTDSRDLQSMPDIASYLNNSGGAADGKHHAIGNWFYWAWNADSGDTGGLVANNWLDIEWQKIDYLSTLALTPWYFNPATQKFGSLCISIADTDGLPSSTLKPITAGQYQFNITNFNTPVCQSVVVGNYTVTAPQIIVSNTQFDAIPQSVTVSEEQTSSVQIVYQATLLPRGSCTVGVKIGQSWQETVGGPFKSSVNFYITNTGGADIVAPWTMTVSKSSYQTVAGSWGVQVGSVQNGTITATAPDSWETIKKNGQNIVNVGMIISSTTNDFLPSSITINGSPCQIVQQ